MRASWFVVTGSLAREPTRLDDGRPAGRLMNAAALRQLQAAGMEVGSHALSHVRLPEIDDARPCAEVVESSGTLQQILGTIVNGFAYPYGAWDGRRVAAVEGAAATMLNNIGDVTHPAVGGGTSAPNLRSFSMFRC